MGYLFCLYSLAMDTAGRAGQRWLFFRKFDSFFKSLNLQNTYYSKLLSWAWNLNLLFTVIGGKFKFQAQDSFLEYLFYLEIWKTNHTFWKKDTFALGK